ncbi:MAG: DUF6883 domain-containing protein [Phormidesmis sp.]
MAEEPSVYLSQDAIIASEKLTNYLLIPLPKDDKSKFLANAGYTLDNWKQLEHDLRTQVLTKPARFLGNSRYGRKYEIRACLKGRNGNPVDVLTIWMIANGTARFVTLVPDKGGNS